MVKKNEALEDDPCEGKGLEEWTKRVRKMSPLEWEKALKAADSILKNIEGICPD